MRVTLVPRLDRLSWTTSQTCQTAINRHLPGTSSNRVQITYVSHLTEDGADPVFVQHQAGHSFASTTAIYTTVGADHVNRAMRAALERAFRDDQEGP